VAIDIKILDKSCTLEVGFAQSQKYPFWYYLSVTLILVGVGARPNCTVFFWGIEFCRIAQPFL
jgi:hypothetical protein